MKRFLALWAVAVLGVCVLAYAFSSQDETTKVVGIPKALNRHDETLPHGRLRQGDQRPYAGRNVEFRYRSWKVFGVDVWTWDGEHWLVADGEAERLGTLDEAKGRYDFAEEVPSEYRTPRGRLLVGLWVVLAVAAVPLWWLIGRRVGSLPTSRLATRPPGETAEPDRRG